MSQTSTTAEVPSVLPRRPHDDAVVSHLDKEILELIVVGKSDRQIGEILGRSAKTVNYHVERLKDRFGVATRLQLVIVLVMAGELRPNVAPI